LDLEWKMARRSLEQWASIAEIVASVAVILSLVYLAYEVRQNTRAMQATARQEFAAQDMAFFATALDPTIVAQARAKLENGEDLTPVEHSQLVNREHMNFRIFENAHYQFKKGALEASEWERYRRIVQRQICEYELAQTMWAQFFFAPEFESEVNEIREGCAPGGTD
jgi:hypothetical protein